MSLISTHTAATSYTTLGQHPTYNGAMILFERPLTGIQESGMGDRPVLMIRTLVDGGGIDSFETIYPLQITEDSDHWYVCMYIEFPQELPDEYPAAHQILKINKSSKTIVWTHSIKDYAGEVMTAADGLGGLYYSVASNDPEFGKFFAVCKLDSAGAITWQRSLSEDPGRYSYDGVDYSNIQIAYDQVRGQLVVLTVFEYSSDPEGPPTDQYESILAAMDKDTGAVNWEISDSSRGIIGIAVTGDSIICVDESFNISTYTTLGAHVRSKSIHPGGLGGFDFTSYYDAQILADADSIYLISAMARAVLTLDHDLNLISYKNWEYMDLNGESVAIADNQIIVGAGYRSQPPV